MKEKVEMMQRCSIVPLQHETQYKKEKVVELLDEYFLFLQKMINHFWNHKIHEKKFADKKDYENIKSELTERYKQCASKQALQIVKSVRRKDYIKQKKPTIKNLSAELDERFVELQTGKNKFDYWLKFSVLNSRRKIKLPIQSHYHFKRFINDGWKLKKSVRFRISNNKKISIDFLFEKEKPEPKINGQVVGLDIGYRKLAVLSDGQIIGKNIEQTIYRYHKRKNSHQIVKEEINRLIKQIDFSQMSVLVVEDLLNLKKNKRGKFHHHTNRLFSNWAYRQALTRIEQLCEENRVLNPKIYPYATSQVCNHCKVRDKRSRKNERYECIHCGQKDDADYNAAMNIRDFWQLLEVYGLQCKNLYKLPMVRKEQFTIV